MDKANWKHYIFELNDKQRRAAIEVAKGIISGTEGASFHLPPHYTEVVGGVATERTTKTALAFTALRVLSGNPEDKLSFQVIFAGLAITRL